MDNKGVENKLRSLLFRIKKKVVKDIKMQKKEKNKI